MIGPSEHVSARLRGELPAAPQLPDGVVAAPLPGARRVVQKVLLLGATGDEPAYLAAKDALVRIGVPHRGVVASTEQVTAQMLTSSSTCNFSSVIFATSGLGYIKNGNWVSALTTAQWQLIANFEAACGAREAIWFSWPSVDLGLNPPTATYQWTDAIDAHVVDASFFASVPATATVPIRFASGYGSSIADAATVALLADTSGNVLLARHTYPDGREVLVSTVDHSPYAAHSLALEYDMLKWLTRGMFVGKKRAYLSPQVDDLFIDNDMWVVGVGTDENVVSRVTGAHVSAFAAWQNGFRASLPSGSSFTTLFAFNGVGAQTGEYDDATLVTASKQAGSSFLWLSHTWDHENMDAMTFSQASSEITRNTTMANQLALNNFSRQDLVTPDVSGLQSASVLNGLYSAGVRNVVSDTSITPALRPQNPGTNPSFNVGRNNPFMSGIYQVPRHPTNLFYNVANPTTWTDEYNFIYRSYYGRDLTYDEIIATDTQFGMFYLLRGDIDPLMFHQLNVADYGAGRSLLGDWLAGAASQYAAVSSAPIRTLNLRDTAAAMKARRAYDLCGITATVVEQGTARRLELRTTNSCTVPVTGLNAPSLGGVETYLGAPTTSVSMSGYSTRTVTLP
ncbi:MAG: hypothetical protein KIT31_33915 [Deltaproteobacteria bacterium]|nr:hypothetical protein [Deltaproteobacteria bacterium]